jgi:hypothetical protein
MLAGEAPTRSAHQAQSLRLQPPPPQWQPEEMQSSQPSTPPSNLFSTHASVFEPCSLQIMSRLQSCSIPASRLSPQSFPVSCSAVQLPPGWFWNTNANVSPRASTTQAAICTNHSMKGDGDARGDNVHKIGLLWAENQRRRIARKNLEDGDLRIAGGLAATQECERMMKRIEGSLLSPAGEMSEGTVLNC